MADFDDDGQTFRRPTPFRQSGAVEGSEPTAKRPTPFRNSHSAPALPETKPSKTEPAPAETIIDGRYRVLERLAAGGMGEVLKVEHLELGRKLALKLMLPALSSDEEFVARFKTEAVAVSRIGHPNIIDVTDFGRTPDGRFYFVMELLEGVTLASALHRGGPMPVERVAKVGAQAARALAAAHAVGIVHRDLKPENVMLVRRGEARDVVKVLDFGVAKVHVSAGGTGQTVAGLVVGTPMYMSPEQARALPVDHRTDIYSLGLILYELISGRTPFTGETPPILMVKHVTERPPALQPGPVEGVPGELESLIFRMLEKEQAKRPQSMAEVAETLEGLMAPRTSGRTPKVEPPLEAPKSKLPWLVLAVVVAVVGVGAVFATSRSAPEPVTESAPVVEPPPRLVEAPAPPTPEAVVISLQSVPAGAEVSSDGVLLGTTPFALRRPAGSQLPLSVTLAGHQTLERRLGFESSQTVTLTLTPAAPAVEPKKKKEKKSTQPVTPELREDPFLQTEDLKDLPPPQE